MPISSTSSRCARATWPGGDSNLHNHKREPFYLDGRACGALKGGLHLKAANGARLANVMLGVPRAPGCGDLDRFGDSTAAFDLSTAPLS